MTAVRGVSIGDKFLSQGKFRRECTVTDIYTTTNLAGEVVQIEFLATHDFMGQKISERVVAPTVLRNKIQKPRT